ncbi:MULTISPECIES: PH domain-containing protein [Exiguobacterium]|uniref:PH domain-containing protein n=1 Tax=Exiguobacterium TaxID=33986 RepID=UPI00135A009E|nr:MULTISPECIES: PH domain-containing protein [Exiguobacterium]
MGNLIGELSWTFYSECEVPSDITESFIDGERAVAAYKTVRDVAVFTNKRLIVRDAQGLTGKKIEVYSLPYDSINMYSTENAGRMFDFNSEVQLFTRAGTIKINLNKKVDVRKFDRLLAEAIL